MVTMQHKLYIERGDITATWLDDARAVDAVACDIETTGLDWRHDQIRTVQVATANAIAIVQLEPDDRPQHLLRLLADENVVKVFHHAPFDLRFLVAKWQAKPASIACTKVAAKIVDPGLPREMYSLKPTLERLLGIRIDKSLQVSDWSRHDLSRAQIDYAANDVRYLLPLLAGLRERAAAREDDHLLNASFAYLPTRAILDTRGVGDVFEY